MRESFFINQVGYLVPLNYAEEGDFSFEGYTFEIGHAHKIPLWLFGFLY